MHWVEHREGELEGCSVVEGCVRAQPVVFLVPRQELSRGFVNRCEGVLVEGFVEQLAVERFDEGVLDRLAGRDVPLLDVVAGCQAQHRQSAPNVWYRRAAP